MHGRISLIFAILVSSTVLASGTSFREAADPACKSVAACRARCDQNALPACRQLGQWYEDGDGIAADARRAVALYTKACSGGDARGCMMLGALLINGKPGVAPDVARAVALFQTACDAHDLYGCAQLGRALLAGQGVSKDAARALEVLGHVCDAGFPAGCGAAGDAAGELGRAEDAARRYLRACDGGFLSGCINLGAQYENGSGVGRDVKKAARLYTKACDGGAPVGCANLATLLDGRRLPADAARVHQLLGKACVAGDEPSCKALRGR